MNKKASIENLKSRIAAVFNDTRRPFGKNIYRGHSRSISSDIEDSITFFISELLPENYYYILDPSIYLNGENNRPDLLIINEKDEVVAMIEMKSNMGWCRNATWVIDDILANDNKFKSVSTLECKLSTDETKCVKYGDNVSLFLVSLTSKNGGSEKNEITNKEYAKQKNVGHYLLFNNWYHSLADKDIEEFADAIIALKA